MGDAETGIEIISQRELRNESGRVIRELRTRSSLYADRMQQSNDEVPDDLRAALRESPEALAAFEALPPSHRREYLRWISEAVRPATRARRIAQAVEMVLAKHDAR